MILLTDEQIRVAKAEATRLSWTHKPHPSYEKDKYLLVAQIKAIAIKLQAIYNLPDGGMFNKKMGEFIEELNEEVSERRRG